MANLNAVALRGVVDSWNEKGAELVQVRVVQVRKAVETFPMIPALAQINEDMAWARTRPPLSPLNGHARRELMLALMSAGFLSD